MAAHPGFLVIGGSAGALEPLLEIVGALPVSWTLPIAVVLHVIPKQPSLLPGLLARQTTRTVIEPDDKEPIVDGTIYVAPANYHMLIERNLRISLSVDEPVNFSRPSIDVLFESAADVYGPSLVALLLSGANDDGASGVTRVVEMGGTALVQRPATAGYPAMPAAALERAPGAHAIAPVEIPDVLAHLQSVARHGASP